MGKNLWQETLKGFKEREKPEAVLMVAGNAELTRIAVAWSNLHVKRKSRLTPFEGDTEEEKWHWLWDNCEFSREELMRRIPGASKTTEQKFTALVANRVLYPDGTLNTFVKKYLGERVLTAFRIQTNQKRRQRTVASS